MNAILNTAARTIGVALLLLATLLILATVMCAVLHDAPCMQCDVYDRYILHTTDERVCPNGWTASTTHVR